MSELARIPASDMQAATLESVLLGGDLERLTPAERVNYMLSVCKSLGLNHLTKPFEFIRLNNKLVMYARKDCTEQLRRNGGISIRIIARETATDVYVVTAQATDRSGRCDESIGAVPLKGLTGEALANAYMKAETKAKRRVTLSISGLGLLDESEVDSIPGAQRVDALTAEPPPKREPKPPKRAAAPPPAEAPRSAAQGRDQDTGEAPPDGDLDEFHDVVVKQLKWKLPHIRNWCGKYFGVKTPEGLTRAQLRDAFSLVYAFAKSREAYAEKVRELAAAGRINADEPTPAPEVRR